MNVLNLFRRRGRRATSPAPLTRHAVGSGRRHRLRFEPLEERRMLSTWYISDWDDLGDVGTSPYLLSDTYYLSDDLDAVDAPANFTPIGDSVNPFTGAFYGSVYGISGLTISSSAMYVGLFGYTDGATLEDIVLDDVEIDVSRNDTAYAGGLVGRALDTQINSCVVTPDSSIDVDLTAGGAYVGGLTGVYRGDGGEQILESHATAVIDVSGATSDLYVGGLVGYMRSESGSMDIEESSAAGTLTAAGSSDIYAGGLVGNFYIGSDSAGTAVGIAASFASTDVSVQSSGGTEYAGGLVGQAYAHGSGSTAVEVIIENSYANGDVEATGSGNGTAEVGGFIGRAYARNSGSKVTIDICYAAGAAAASASTVSYAGGFVGRYYEADSAAIEVWSSFAVGVADATDATTTYEGGFAGANPSAYHNNSWWANETNGSDVGTGSGSGITEENDGADEFYDKYHSVYVSGGANHTWDFAAPADWIEHASDLPTLSWE